MADALESVTGLDGKTVIDATNLIGADPPDGFASNAEYVKSKTNGPTSKAFNLNFARNFGEIENQPVRPSQLYSGDEEARERTEQLIRDADLGFTFLRDNLYLDFFPMLAGEDRVLRGPAGDGRLAGVARDDVAAVAAAALWRYFLRNKPKRAH